MTVINVGSSANDGTGDPLREMGIKINTRFNELQGLLDGGDPWAAGTAYTATPVRQWVINGGQAYVAVSNHTSGSSFANDLAAGRWIAADAAQIVADLADKTFAAKNAGMIGFDALLNYEPGSVGHAVKDASQESALALQTVTALEANTALLAPIYPSVAAGLAATTNNAIFSVISPDDSASLLHYQNVSGTALLVGSSPSQLSIDAVAEKVVVDVNSQYVAAVQDPTGKYAPFMNEGGELVSIRGGEAKRVPVDGELLGEDSLGIGLIDNERAYRITIDPNGKVIEAWTDEGGYYIASDAGLVRTSQVLSAAVNAPAYEESAADVTLYGVAHRIGALADPDICYILPTLGQSIALGQNNTNDAIVAGTALYPANAFMFAGTSPRRNATPITTLVPLIEADTGSAAETAASGWANHLIRDVALGIGRNIRTISFTSSVGGVPYRRLKKGSAAYATFVQGVADAVTICKTNGWIPIVPAIDWAQGESDTDQVPGMSQQWREGQMLQLAHNVAADVKALTGQTSDPILMITQTAFAPGAEYFNQPVRLADLALHGQNNIRLVGPMYQFPTAVGDTIHLGCIGQNARGQQLARATISEIFGAGWRPIKPLRSRWVNATTFDIDFDCPLAPLVIDTSNAIVDSTTLGAGRGFLFDDRSGSAPAITSVTVTGNTTVRIVLASAPAAANECRVSYAMQSTTTNTYGPLTGARGCLRDSAPSTNQYTSTVWHNWCPAFSLELEDGGVYDPLELNRTRSETPCAIICSLNTAPYIPNIDTTAGTFTFQGNDTILIYGNSFKILDTAVSADLLSVASSAKKVYYSIGGDTLTVKAFNTALTPSEQRDLVLVAAIRYNGNSTVAAMSCPYTVNGGVPLPNNFGLEGKTASIFTPLSGVSEEENFPNYNAATNTLTFYADTIFSVANFDWVVPANTPVVLGPPSTANIVWWDVSINALVATAWNTVLTATQRMNYVLVASVREAPGVPTSVAISCPYTVDNRLYNIAAENRKDANVQGIAHRGLSTFAPENTLPAYVLAGRRKIFCVEGDIRFTSDDVPVLLHDSTIDRTSDGTGAISGMTLTTAKTFDFGSWKAAKYTGTTIPTFEEAMRLLKKLDMIGYFELKTVPTVAQVQNLIAILRRTGMYGKVELSSFDLGSIQTVVAQDSSMLVGYLGSLSAAHITACVGLKTATNKVSALVSFASVTPALVESAHTQGLNVACWTVNSDADVIAAADAGVDGIITDGLNIAQVLRSSEGI